LGSLFSFCGNVISVKYELVDCCPVPTKLAPVLRQIKADTGCVYQSIYRGVDARGLLNQCGKHDQAWLFANLPRGVANPPGRSTHELKNDGVAYPGPAYIPLPWWCCGIDVDDAHVAAFVRAAAKHGYRAAITYPTSRAEYHHVNFRKAPIIKRASLKRGDKGAGVVKLSRRLAFVRSPHTHKPYLTHKYTTFTVDVERALRAFQAEHHQHPDGVYGPQTVHQLDVSTRYWKQHK
jgi:hypothetical protein